MMMMLELFHDIGKATSHALWIPVAVWTVGAVFVDALLRGVRPSPLVRYRVRQAVLFALPLGLIAGPVLHLPLSGTPVTAVASKLALNVPSLPPVDVASTTAPAFGWTHAGSPASFASPLLQGSCIESVAKLIWLRESASAASSGIFGRTSGSRGPHACG